MTEKRVLIWKRLAAMMLALSLVLMLPGCGPKKISMPAAGHSVADEANILSPETEALVDQYSAALQAASGAQIGVLTVQDTGKTKLSRYAGDAYEAWGIGDAKKKNGALLVLVTGGGGNYWCVQGKGLAKEIAGADISGLLNTYLEPGFAAGDFDGGVTAFVEALAGQIASAEGTALNLEQQGTAGFDGTRAPKSTVKHLLLMAGLFLVLFVVLLCAALMGSTGQKAKAPARSRKAPATRSTAELGTSRRGAPARSSRRTASGSHAGHTAPARRGSASHRRGSSHRR